jgi:WD40 repeat protein
MARRLNTRFSVAIAVATTIALSSGSGQAYGQGVLAFTSDRCGEGGKPTHDYFSSRARCRDSIWLVNDDGSDPRRLTKGAFPGHEEEDGGGDFGPTWSPDGTRLVFTRGLSQGSRLVIMNADGTGQSVLLKQPLPEGFETQEEPTWSRDGLQILFTSKRFGWDYTSAIFSVDPSGTLVRRLTAVNELATLSGFSANGLKILFHRELVRQRPTDPPVTTPAGTYAMNRDGSGRTLVAEGDAGRLSFSYSPDGRYLAMTVREVLYTMTADGHDVRARMFGAYPGSWSLFGPTLFFSGFVGEPPDIRKVLYRLDPASPNPSIRITDPVALDFTPAWSLLGRRPRLPNVPDMAPPIATLLGAIEVKGISAARAGRPTARVASRLPYLVVDGSGIRKVKAAIGRRVRRRCRFVTGVRLGRRRSCSRPSYFVVRGPRNWTRRVRKLPAGRYEVRFRATDVRGNTTHRSRLHVVRLR